MHPCLTLLSRRAYKWRIRGDIMTTDTSRTQRILAELDEIERQRNEALQHYIAPFGIRTQELLTELGASLSGFAIDDIIECRTEGRRITVTGLSAHRAGGVWYWVARGNGTVGPESAFGIVPNKWRLAVA